MDNNHRPDQENRPDITTALRANGHLVRECWDAAEEIEWLRDRMDHFRLQWQEARMEIHHLHRQIRDLQSQISGLIYVNSTHRK